MRLTDAQRRALAHMAGLERLAAEQGTCPHAAPGQGPIHNSTAAALVRLGLAEKVKWCRHGADWPEVRLTERGRGAAEGAQA